MEILKCKHCGNEDQSKMLLSESGPHTKASCGICREFIKFVPAKIKKKKHNLF
jgi:transcription elongation factor Elf1